MIPNLQEKHNFSPDSKAFKCFTKIQKLIDTLNHRGIPEGVEAQIHQEIQSVNALEGTEKELSKPLRKAYFRLLKLVQKELGWVTKSFHTSLWMSLGMAIFGLPIGLIIGFSIDNLGLLGIGLPIGMAVGIAIGSVLDANAAKEGKQLDLG